MPDLPFPDAGKPNWANQTIWTGDNLDIMRGMNSESVDLIYLDPPFNSKHDYSAPIGSKAAGAAFKDTWGLDDVNLAWHGEIKHDNPGLYDLLNATRQVHGDSMMSYLIYMAIRITEMRRLLKLSGSIYLHCDPTASHYLKLLMDSVFGRKRFRNEIIWSYSGWNKRLKKHIERRHDVVLFYSKHSEMTFNYPTRPWSSKDEYIKTRKQKVRVDDDGNEYVLSDGGSGQRVKRYLDDAMSYGVPLDDVWKIEKLNNSDTKERTGYPTQKPLALLRRIIAIGSNSGDTVLDPFCGCATACIAAQDLSRHWAGIDISPKAADLVQSRMQDELGLFYRGAHREDIPRRTDIGTVLKYNDAKNKRYLYGEQGGYCLGCEEHFPPRNLTIDHIIPRSRGGTDHISNLQLLCGACNSVKGDRPHEYLLACLTDKGFIKRRRAA